MPSCKVIAIEKDVCYIRFSDDKIDHSEDIGCTTRGEMVIVDYTKQNAIRGIELVGKDKPCQGA
jgi:hypothetical protein